MGSETTVASPTKKNSPSKDARKSATAIAKVNRGSTTKDKSLPACIVVDTGGWTVKYGLVPPLRQSNDNGPASQIMSTMYNATARPPHQLTVLTGDEITTRMKNLGQLTWNNSMERGMITDGETQLRVWARTLEVLGVVPTPQIKGGGFLKLQGGSAAKRRGGAANASTAGDATASRSNASIQKYSSNDCTFLLLEPPHVPSVISEGVDCILFRELGVGRVARVLGPCMAAVKYLSVGKRSAGSDDQATTINSEWLNDDTNCCCVIDSGYSFTHVVPTHRGGAMTKAIRRLDIGGKVLTNLLKEAVTYRQWNMMDEYHIVNDAKEQLSFVSDKFESEMKQAHVTRKGLRWFDREYLLPDFVSSTRGSVRLPAPLQRKREMEKMEEMKLEKERKEREEKEDTVSDVDHDGNDQQIEDEGADAASEMDVDDTTSANKKKNSDSKRQKKEKGKKKTKKRSKKRKHDSKQSDDDDEADMSGGEDSDEESDEQRLKRLKAMRDEERKRREREERERQALALSVERFAIPEVLFRPSDIGMNCGGIVEAIVESINACDEIYRAAMYNNVLLVGGNATIPGFKERVESELRKLAPTNYPVRVYLPNDPVSYAWEGAVQFSQQDGFQKQFSIDRVSWETMKKAGKDQSGIWGERINITGK